MDQLSSLQNMEITEQFSNEVIWENSRDLFSKYFKTNIVKEKYRLSTIVMEENLNFDDAIKYLNNF